MADDVKDRLRVSLFKRNPAAFGRAEAAGPVRGAIGGSAVEWWMTTGSVTGACAVVGERGLVRGAVSPPATSRDHHGRAPSWIVDEGARRPALGAARARAIAERSDSVNPRRPPNGVRH